MQKHNFLLILAQFLLIWGEGGGGGQVLVQLVHCEREDWNPDNDLSLKNPSGG